MKTTLTTSTHDVVRFSSSQSAPLLEDGPPVGAAVDNFEQPTVKKDTIKYRHVIADAKKLWGTPLENSKPAPPECIFERTAIAHEEEFIAQPTARGFLELVSKFEKTMRVVGHEKYQWNDYLAVKTQNASTEALDLVSGSKERKHEDWLKKNHLKHEYHYAREQQKSTKRRDTIERKGQGFGGKMTSTVGKSKSMAFFAKNNLTLRGNVFKLTHAACPKNIYEIMPRYGFRKGAHVGVRVTQFTLTTILSGMGYGLAPSTYGISKIVTDHARTVITLSGEVITHKIAGAENSKCTVHAALRGVQLEVPHFIPVVGDMINIAEKIAFGTAAVGIVSTTLADMLLSQMSDRYTSTLNLDDLGDSRCLAELNDRIDYLSRFLLPYGQYLLLKETDVATRKKMKKTLKENFSLLRNLEKKKVRSLNYYRLALAAEKIPQSRREQVSKDCNAACADLRVNTHRVTKKCLATLIAKDPDLRKNRSL